MASRLVNVRLDEERLRKARRLRDRGITLSELVREAIDERYGTPDPLSPAEARAIIARIHQQHPDAGEVEPRDYDVHDAAAARAAIRRRIRRRP